MRTFRRSSAAPSPDTAQEAYDRVSWIAYGVMVLGVPFTVLVFRTHMAAWHYYVAGGICVACGLLICALNLVDARLTP
jgi:hypothetical protein